MSTTPRTRIRPSIGPASARPCAISASGPIPSPRRRTGWRGRVRRCRPAQRTSPGAWCGRASSARCTSTGTALPGSNATRSCGFLQRRCAGSLRRPTVPAPPRPRAFSTAFLPGVGARCTGRRSRCSGTRSTFSASLRRVSAEVATAGPSSAWDGRWTVHGPEIKGFTIRALGDDGWRQIPQALRDGTAPDLPRHAIARTLPAIFDGERLVGFRPRHFGVGYVAEFRPPCGHFLALLNPH
jgi:hypothetical protein